MRPATAIAVGVLCVGATVQDGQTPLHLAAQIDLADIAKLLLDKGANKEAKDNVRRATRPEPALPLRHLHHSSIAAAR